MAKNEAFDFLAAIEAHVRWKVRLEAHIAGTGEEDLNADVVGRDDQCALGKWIYGEGGQQFSDHPGFQELKDIHTEFHQNAGKVITLADSGDPEGARKLMNQGAYNSCSARIKSKLARMSLELDHGE